MALGLHATLPSATWCPCIEYQSNYFVPKKHTLKQALLNTACITIDLKCNSKGKQENVEEKNKSDNTEVSTKTENPKKK